MKRSKFSEDQIAYALRQAQEASPAGDACRQIGIREATFYAWKKKFPYLGVSELRRPPADTHRPEGTSFSHRTFRGSTRSSQDSRIWLRSPPMPG